MRLFGKRAAEPARPALVRAVSGIAGGQWPRSYDGQVRDAYLANPIAQRAVRIVAEGAAGVPVYALEAEGARAEALLAQAGLVETVAAYLLLHGNAFVQILGDAEGVPAELFALRPERVTIEQDARGWPAAYLYRASEAAMRIPACDGAGKPGLVHLRAFNPIDDHYGVGSLGAAAGAVAVHNAAAKWNKSLLDNAARPSGALVYDPGEAGAAMSGEQFDRSAGQAQKEIYHNEALTILDALVQPVVETAGDDAPPVSQAEGKSWIIGSAPTGDWAGHGGAIATWSASGWRFAPPAEGMAAWVADAGVFALYTDGAWSVGLVPALGVHIEGVQVIGAQRPAIPDPAGGGTVDSEARTTLAAILAAMRDHGLIAM
jgi:hypothetical protein